MDSRSNQDQSRRRHIPNMTTVNETYPQTRRVDSSLRGVEVKKYHRPPTRSRRAPARSTSTSNCASSRPVSKMYRVGNLKASPWVDARPVLGTAPTVSRVGAPQVLWERGEGFPSSRRALFVLTEAHFTRVSPNRVWGWCRRGEWNSLQRGTPLTLLRPASRRHGPFGIQR